MSWSWSWHPAALHGLRSLPPWTGARLDAAVLAYAATGQGPVTQLVPTDPHRLVLRVEGAGALLFLHEETRTVEVMRAWRRR